MKSSIRLNAAVKNTIQQQLAEGGNKAKSSIPVRKFIFIGLGVISNVHVHRLHWC